MYQTILQRRNTNRLPYPRRYVVEGMNGYQLDSLIPASKISNLTQGMFVGAVSDNFDEWIDQKIFHTEILVDNERVKR